MKTHDSFCQIHRVWYSSDCKQCIVDAWAKETVVYIEGEPRTPKDAIRRARRVSGLSQNKLVREAGMARAQICKWETGKTSPRLDLFLRTMATCGYRVTVEKINEGKAK